MERMKAVLCRMLTAAALALSVVLAPGTEASAHKSILKVEFAERRELNVLIDNFALTDQNGGRVEFRKLRGKPLVINFMYTSCPDVCPLLTASLKILRDHMKPAEARDIRFLSITTDPEIDSPKVLKAYSKRHEADAPNWWWLTGEARELAPVWQGFGVSVKRLAKGLIEHTTLTVVADAQGFMRFAYFGSAPDPDVLLKDLRALEKEAAT
ncbi:MAG: SCO family protein [Deltaproteobacteria bacterium]|nr:SCO family protein [Deltaproteobacteria bacterium]